MEDIGYIYLRDNAWYKSENTIKLGIASNTKERDGTYVTGEIIRGEFIKVFEVPHDKMRVIDLPKKMKSLGCSDALNLDGGGSTILYENGGYIYKQKNIRSYPNILSW